MKPRFFSIGNRRLTDGNKILPTIFFALAIFSRAAFASDEETSKSGFFSRLWHPQMPGWPRLPHWGGKNSGKGLLKNLEIDVQLSPQPLKLGEARQIQAKVTLRNKSKKFTGLEFPTSQRIEVLIRDSKGKIVTQWSEDRSFENVSAYVGLNPGERLEYTASLPTRDLHAGELYTLEAFFPNFDELKVRRPITPQK